MQVSRPHDEDRQSREARSQLLRRFHEVTLSLHHRETSDRHDHGRIEIKPELGSRGHPAGSTATSSDAVGHRAHESRRHPDVLVRAPLGIRHGDDMLDGQGRVEEPGTLVATADRSMPDYEEPPPVRLVTIRPGRRLA